MRKWMGGDSITPLAAMDLDVAPVTDRIWLATRPGVLSERNLRHLACDFAEHVLPYFERACPCDKRPRVAIETARRYADGETTKQEMREAASYAASASYAATYRAYRASERKWQLERCRHWLRIQEQS
jgi:hypothetical protein